MINGKSIVNLPCFADYFKILALNICGPGIQQALEQYPGDLDTDTVITIKNKMVDYIAENLRNMMIKQYNNCYTTEELQQIFAFYSLPVASKAINLSSVFMREITEWLKQHSAQLRQVLAIKTSETLDPS